MAWRADSARRVEVSLAGLVECGIAEDAGAEHVRMLAELRFRVQGAACVVEVDLVELVEPRVLARPQRLDGVPVPVGIGREAGRRAPGMPDRRQHDIDARCGHGPQHRSSRRQCL